MTADIFQMLLERHPDQGPAIERMRQFVAAGKEFDVFDLRPPPPDEAFFALVMDAVHSSIIEVFVRLVAPTGEVIGEYEGIFSVPDEYRDSAGNTHRTYVEHVHVRYRGKSPAGTSATTTRKP